MTRFTKKRTEFLPLCRPMIGDEEIHAVTEILRSGWITSGPKVLEFEASFRALVGADHAICVNSATSGWHILAHALGVGPGKEVIVPAITWPSVANVVELLGGTTVLADIDADTLQVQPNEIARLLNDRTCAVMPVHFAGAPVDLDACRSVLQGHKAALVEDAAHALGTQYKGRHIGQDSQASIFSFHPIKNITTGEGGMIVCYDAELAEKVRCLRFHGISKDAWKRYSKGASPAYEVITPGYKCNLTDIQAAIGIAQLPKLEHFNEARRKIAGWYDRALASIDEIERPAEVPYAHVHARHLYVVRLRLDRLTIDRNAFIDALAEENIGAGIHFPAIHTQRYYREKYHYTEADLPHAAAVGKSIVSLPLFPTMTETDVDDVARAIKRIVHRNSQRSIPNYMKTEQV